MTQKEILEEIKKLTPTERLKIIETTLQLIREDIQQAKPSLAKTPKTKIKRQLAAAAKALLSDYAKDRELTIFTALDSEDFHAQG